VQAISTKPSEAPKALEIRQTTPSGAREDQEKDSRKMRQLALSIGQKKKLSLLKQEILSNRFGFLWLIGMVTLSLLITTIPFIRPYLHASAIPINVWFVILVVIFCSTWWIEVSKIVHSNVSLQK
jgi:hypothetical protein